MLPVFVPPFNKFWCLKRAMSLCNLIQANLIILIGGDFLACLYLCVLVPSRLVKRVYYPWVFNENNYLSLMIEEDEAQTQNRTSFGDILILTERHIFFPNSLLDLKTVLDTLAHTVTFYVYWQYFEEMKNTLIHNCIGSHTNCFMSLLGQ